MSDILHTAMTLIISSRNTCLSHVTLLNFIDFIHLAISFLDFSFLHWASPRPGGNSSDDSLSNFDYESSPIVWPLFRFLVFPPLDDPSPDFLPHPLLAVTLRPISTQTTINSIPMKISVNGSASKILGKYVCFHDFKMQI